MSYGMAYSFGQFGSAIPALSPYKILPSLLMDGRDAGENSADAVPALPGSSQNTGVLSTPFQLPRPSTALGGCCEETSSSSARPNTNWMGLAIPGYSPSLMCQPYSKVLVSHPVPQWSPGSSGSPAPPESPEPSCPVLQASRP